MAPAVVDTIQAHFRDFRIEPGYYDLIVTGDLLKWDMKSHVIYLRNIKCQCVKRNIKIVE